MADAPTTGVLHRKVLNIPVMYWLGIFVIALAAIAWRMKNQTTMNAANVTPDTAGDPGSTDGASADYGNSNANPAPQVPTVYAPGNSTGIGQLAPTTTVETNESWLNKSVSWLVQSGYSAGTVQVALQAYLDGEQLSFDQGHIRDMAVKQFGPPPESFHAGDTGAQTAAPAKKQGPLPRSHKVLGPNDNTFPKLANLYYNRGGRDEVLILEAANYSRLPGDGPFAVGTMVYVPVFHTPRYFTSTKQYDTKPEIAKKNGITQGSIDIMNPGMRWPLKPGTRVRVG